MSQNTSLAALEQYCFQLFKIEQLRQKYARLYGQRVDEANGSFGQYFTPQCVVNEMLHEIDVLRELNVKLQRTLL